MKKNKGYVEASLAMLVFFGVWLSAEHYVQHYNKECTVLSNNGNEVILMDSKDNLWVWEEENSSLRPHEIVKVKFHNNLTDNNIYDDIIVKIERGE